MVYINVKYLKIIFAVSLIILGFTLVFHGNEQVNAGKMEYQVCKNYRIQSDAQRVLDIFKGTEYEKYAQVMDRDKDGIACEHLPLK